jgi:hypothetical protein
VTTDKILIFNENVEVDGKLEHFCISCRICKIQEAEASQISKDVIVPLARGISVESKKSKAHQAADEAARLWEPQYDKILKQYRAAALNHLIALCIYVYSDSNRNIY